MNCADVELELVAFHFGELALAARDPLEAHLVQCPRCVAAFLDLKKSIEGVADVQRPSPRARARLRAAVMAEVAPRPWVWWERPAAFTAAALVALLALTVTFAAATGPGVAPKYSSPQFGDRLTAGASTQAAFASLPRATSTPQSAALPSRRLDRPHREVGSGAVTAGSCSPSHARASFIMAGSTSCSAS